MHPSNRTFLVIEGNTALDQLSIEPARFEFTAAERSREEPPLVFNQFRMNNQGALERSFDKFHRTIARTGESWK